MVASSWFTSVLGVIAVVLRVDRVSAKGGLRLATSPSYRHSNPCPERCSTSGANTGNWSAYPNFQQIKRCPETMFYDFSLYDEVDDDSSSHRINAFSSFGTDFAKLTSSEPKSSITVQPVNVPFEIGWWEGGVGLAASALRSLITQMREYVDNGNGATDRSFIMFGQSGQVTIGLYIGQGLSNQGLRASAMKLLGDNLDNLNVSTPSLAMQLCGPDYDSDHIFGIIVASNGTFTSTSFTGQVMYTTRLLPTNGTANSTLVNSTMLSNTSIQHQAHKRHQSHQRFHARADCRTVQVQSGDSCVKLAAKCGITAAEFTKINSDSKFCANLRPKQHVCCSSGTLPDFSPSQGSDGTCYKYQVKTNDNCDDLAAKFSLTRDKIEAFNKNTWGWNGCKLLFIGTNMCLSKGTAPFPAPVANAQCGPQKLNSRPPTDGTKITDMNPYFCVDTNTGAPGTAKSGTYGCISNCGTDIVKGSGSGNIKIAYYEGYGMNRYCLLQDASQIDTAMYTHIHFAFGTLTNTYEVETGDELSTYQFTVFKKIQGAKRILSFGGWDFSTFPATYAIFRDGVTSANRLKMATNIANFIKKHDLDGVDIDWEYPGAPDLPGIPAASTADGPNYLAFLVILKNFLPGKSVSIAAPSSYWYLKQFPIKNIGRIVDYIVYITYDLHSQWDAGNAHSQERCANGNCLRSQVNLTETKQSLAMITKAGVPGSKIIVGITSYGRSFNMAQAGCWGPGCLYTSTRENPHATKGKCTGTAGYIADAEIEDIVNDRERAGGREVKNFLDTSSHTDILVYDDTQWVSYMSASTKKSRSTFDLQTFHDVPKPAESWAKFKQLIKAGEDPKADHTRNKNWTSFHCDHVLIDDSTWYTPEQQWRGLNADAAWKDIIRVWKDTDRNRGIDFTESVSETTNVASDPECQKMEGSDCEQSVMCSSGLDAEDSGPAARLIFNSFVFIHYAYQTYHNALFDVAAVTASKSCLGFFLLDVLTLETLSAAGPFFNTILKKVPYFVKHNSAFDSAKDTTFTLVGQSTTIAKDLLSLCDSERGWTPEAQDEFSSYIGTVISGWAAIASIALRDLFNGTDESIDILDGFPDPMSSISLWENIEKSIFGFAIPALWTVSKAYAFIIDSGDGCDGNNIGKYMDDDTMTLTGSCVDGKKYYLATPEGDFEICQDVCDGGSHCHPQSCRNNKFSAPKGVDYLGGNFGGITKNDLKGGVRTWVSNGRKNGAPMADLTNSGTMSNLLDLDVTTPGFIRIPICSPDRAFQSWKARKGASPNYPCDPPQRCGESSFEDQTSSASANVDDCLQIIKNIEGNIAATNWTTEVVGKRQREIVNHESCSLGVEADKINGNVIFVVSAQDVINIITTAIEKFGRSGKVGAKGYMSCSGNMEDQAVEWGLY
ncbi:glycoside hydrolase [Decorospora gaudefroyi]|uniref:chitinase n=1 Tax=Decorospora gaudefroyi TaxID=184978 RepID=A0A6A5KHV4_9PLEO|nr:glycoside hydrolase [Decorospora gaudefroyi]